MEQFYLARSRLMLKLPYDSLLFNVEHLLDALLGVGMKEPIKQLSGWGIRTTPPL